jgi:antitoxin component of MazEF toxin-antitoxin module
VPREYLEQHSIGDRVTLEVTNEGVLIRPVAAREAATTPLLAGLEEEEPPALRRGLRGWWTRVRSR